MKTENLKDILANEFWHSHQIKLFSAAEISLFFYLLHMADMSQSFSDLDCVVIRMAGALRLSQPSVVKARQALVDRGLIAPTNPLQPKPLNRISFILPSKNLSSNFSFAFNNNNNNNINNKEININKEKKEKKEKEEVCEVAAKQTVAPQPPAEEAKPVEELRGPLTADRRWHEAMRVTLSKEKPLQLHEVSQYVEDFFNELECNCSPARTEYDCRRYCFNWIRHRLRTPSTSPTPVTTLQPPAGKIWDYHPRRGMKSVVATPEDYAAPF